MGIYEYGTGEIHKLEREICILEGCNIYKDGTDILEERIGIKLVDLSTYEFGIRAMDELGILYFAWVVLKELVCECHLVP